MSYDNPQFPFHGYKNVTVVAKKIIHTAGRK